MHSEKLHHDGKLDSIMKLRFAFLLQIYIPLISCSLSSEKEPESAYCPAGFVQFHDKCYLYLKERQPHIQAVDVCENMYFGKLASIESKEQQKFLSHYLFRTLQVMNHVWIGGKAMKKEGDEKYTVIWSDGAPLNFTNWMPGEPAFNTRSDYRESAANCVYMSSLFDNAGKWAIGHCFYDFSVLCERHLETSNTLVKPGQIKEVTKNYVNLNWVFAIVIVLFAVLLGAICYIGNFNDIRNAINRRR